MNKSQAVLKSLSIEKIVPIVTGAVALEFLMILRAAENLSTDNSKSIAELLRERLSRYRHKILGSPPESTKHVANGNTIDAEEFLNLVKPEENFFQSVMDEFEVAEMRYLETHATNF